VIGFVLARRYARAIIDLAQETGQVEEIGEELGKIAALFADSHELLPAAMSWSTFLPIPR
jgi:F0F1-type ATP synthase delta subunit